MAEVAGPVREDFMLGEGGKSKKNLALSYLNSIKGNDALIVAIANKLTGEGTATPATAWSTIKEKAADPPAVFGGSGPSKYAALVDFAKALVVQPPPLTPAQQAAKDAAEVLATQAAAHAQKAADEKAAAAALALRCADYGKHAADVTVALFPTYGTTPHGAAAVHEAVSRICYGGAKDPLIAVAHRSALLKDLTDAQYAALKEQQGHAILDMVHVLISLPAPGAPPAPPPLPSLGGGSAGGGTVVSAVTQKALDAARASAAAATKAVDLIVPRVELPLTIMRENAWELAARSVHVPLLDLSLVVDEVSKEMGWVVLPAAHTLLTTKAMDPPTPLPADLIAKAWAAAAEAHSLAHDVARPQAFRGGRLMSLLTRQVAAHPPSGVATPAELKAYITRTVESVHHLECAAMGALGPPTATTPGVNVLLARFILRKVEAIAHELANDGETPTDFTLAKYSLARVVTFLVSWIAAGCGCLSSAVARKLIVELECEPFLLPIAAVTRLPTAAAARAGPMTAADAKKHGHQHFVLSLPAGAMIFFKDPARGCAYCGDANCTSKDANPSRHKMAPLPLMEGKARAESVAAYIARATGL